MTSLTGFKNQDFRLDGNTYIRLRAVKPEDRESFATEFEALSEEARYCRCFAYRNTLKESELDMLCNVDGVNHVAVVALQLNNIGVEKQGIGGARFIRHHCDEASAEMAFLVTDAWQRRHIGRLMVTGLIEHARQAGIASLRCHLLPGNNKARGLLSHVARVSNCSICFDQDGALLQGLPLRSAPGTTTIETISI